LKLLIPGLYNELTNWQTGYEEKHAYEFTEEQLIQFHNTCPNDVNGILFKCYSSIAAAYAARSSDPTFLMRDQITV